MLNYVYQYSETVHDGIVCWAPVNGLVSEPFVMTIKWNTSVLYTQLESNIFLYNIQKTKIMASGPITSWEIDGETGEIDGETVETVSDFIFWGAPKSLQMVTAAMKLKDAYSLEEKLWPT